MNGGYVVSDNDFKNIKLPHFPESYWRDSVTCPKFPNMTEDIQVDVIIVGGGMTGIVSAYLLANEGVKVAILEAGNVLSGTTGHTTAKITAQHHLIYDEFIENFGKSNARLYYEANEAALHFIKENINRHQIDCDYTEQDAYIYATTVEYARKLEKEVIAYQKLGIDGEMIDSIPFDMKIEKGVVMKKQGQFHPVKYLTHLLGDIVEKGGLVFENTTAVNIEGKEQPTVLTRDGARATGKFVLSCSHFPFYEGIGLYFAKMYANRSYVIAAKTKQSFPGGMYISAENPIRSIRTAEMNGENLVLIGGESHKTGQGKKMIEHYKALADFGQEALGIDNILYRWSAQDLTTLDKIPYIGEISANRSNILIATGFRKWGMTNSIVAAMLFRDKILRTKNPYQSI